MTDAFEDQDCITCFVRFRVPVGFTAQRREDCANFYCPNGHQMVYSKTDTPEAQLRRERDLLAQQIAQRDDEIRAQRLACEEAERREAAAKGRITKLKKRASAGVCPCCNRTFLALQKHMAQKHPGFTAENVVELGAKRA